MLRDDKEEGRRGTLAGMSILRAFAVLLLAQFAGEAVHRLLHLPLPGPVLGMAGLAAWLLLRGGEPDAALAETSETLLRWMPLLFVPAGAGVFAYPRLLRAGLLPIAVSLVVSTLLTFAVTAWVLQLLSRRAQPADSNRAEAGSSRRTA